MCKFRREISSTSIFIHRDKPVSSEVGLNNCGLLHTDNKAVTFWLTINIYTFQVQKGKYYE